MVKVGDNFPHETDDGWYAVKSLSKRRAWDMAVERAPFAQWSDDITGCVEYQWHEGRQWPEEVALVIEVDTEGAEAIVFWEGKFYLLYKKLEAHEVAEGLIESAFPNGKASPAERQD